MLGWFRNIVASKNPRRAVRAVRVLLVRGRYDAAATTEENRRHWANVDLLSAATANSPVVRRTLRSRARYEVANNSYARGIVLTLANDCIGTGPRLQILCADAQVMPNSQVEEQANMDEDTVTIPETAPATPVEATQSTTPTEPLGPTAAEIRAQAAAEATRIADIHRQYAGRYPELEAQAIREGWDLGRAKTEFDLANLRDNRPKASGLKNTPRANDDA